MIFKIKIEKDVEKVYELTSYEKYNDENELTEQNPEGKSFLLNMGEDQYELTPFEFIDNTDVEESDLIVTTEYIEASILTNSLVVLETIKWESVEEE